MKFSKQSLLFIIMTFVFVCLSLAVWFGQFKMGDGSDLSLSTKIVISVVAILILSGSAFDIINQILERKKLLREFDIVTKYNIRIKSNGYNFDVKKANIELDWMVYRFESYGIKDVQSHLYSYGNIFCEFHPEITTVPGTTFKVMGYSYRGSNDIHVSYFNRSLDKTDENLGIERTAFSHELSHLILFKARPELSEEDHHKMISFIGLS